MTDFSEIASIKQLGWTSGKIFDAYKEQGQIILRLISAIGDDALLSALQLSTGAIVPSTQESTRHSRSRPENEIFKIAAMLSTVPCVGDYLSPSTIMLEDGFFSNQGDDFAT